MDEVTYYNLSRNFSSAFNQKMLFLFAYHLYTDHDLSMRTVCKRCGIDLKEFSAYVRSIRETAG